MGFEGSSVAKETYPHGSREGSLSWVGGVLEASKTSRSWGYHQKTKSSPRPSKLASTDDAEQREGSLGSHGTWVLLVLRLERGSRREAQLYCV